MIFHHVGHICASLERSRQIYEKLGFVAESPVTLDSHLGVKLVFLVKDGFRLELIEPLPSSTSLHKLLAKRSGAYHYAFSCSLSESALVDWAAQLRLVCSVSEAPARAFPGATVSFFIAPDGSVLEVIRK